MPCRTIVPRADRVLRRVAGRGDVDALVGLHVPGGEAAPLGSGNVKPPPLELGAERTRRARRWTREPEEPDPGDPSRRGSRAACAAWSLESCCWSSATCAAAFASWPALAGAAGPPRSAADQVHAEREPGVALRQDLRRSAAAGGPRARRVASPAPPPRGARVRTRLTIWTSCFWIRWANARRSSRS